MVLRKCYFGFQCIYICLKIGEKLIFFKYIRKKLYLGKIFFDQVISIGNVDGNFLFLLVGDDVFQCYYFVLVYEWYFFYLDDDCIYVFDIVVMFVVLVGKFKKYWLVEGLYVDLFCKFFGNGLVFFYKVLKGF